MTRDAHDGGDSPKKATKGPKSGLKKEMYGILTILLLGTRRVRIRARGSRTRNRTYGTYRHNILISFTYIPVPTPTICHFTTFSTGRYGTSRYPTVLVRYGTVDTYF